MKFQKYQIEKNLRFQKGMKFPKILRNSKNYYEIPKNLIWNKRKESWNSTKDLEILKKIWYSKIYKIIKQKYNIQKSMKF